MGDTWDLRFKKEKSLEDGDGDVDTKYMFDVPKIRRSSPELSPEVNGKGNVVFHDAQVKNMRVSVVNHCSCEHTQCRTYQEVIGRMARDKVDLIKATDKEMERLRDIIRVHCAV